MATEGVETMSSELLGIQLEMPRRCPAVIVPAAKAPSAGTKVAKAASAEAKASAAAKAAANKAAAAATEATKAAAGTEATAAGTPRLKVVEEQYIFDVLAARTVYPPTLPTLTYDSLPSTFTPATRAKLAAANGQLAAHLKGLWAAQDEILKQYADEGSAYVVV